MLLRRTLLAASLLLHGCGEAPGGGAAKTAPPAKSEGEQVEAKAEAKEAGA